MGQAGAQDWDCDILVAGSGAAGLTAALVAALQGMRVLLIEKTKLIGGTTAYSGGVIWVPGNKAAHGSGFDDDRRAAAHYLDTLIGKGGDARRAAYLETASEAIAFLERRSSVRFLPVTEYPDYHPEVPGAAIGRAMAPAPYDARKLSHARFEQIRPPRRDTMLFGKMMLDRADLNHLLRPWASPKALLRSAGLLARYWRDRLHRSRGAQLRSGNALVARLVESLDAHGVQLLLETRLKRLVIEKGRVCGAVVEDCDQERTIRARLGVILATGGCASSVSMRDTFAGAGLVPLSVAPDANCGDGLTVGLSLGAKLDKDMRAPFFMFPGSQFQGADGQPTAWPHLTFADRAKPGLIAVDETGARFVNEASSYQIFSEAMLGSAKGRSGSRFHLICSRNFLKRYGLGVVRPFGIGLRRHRKTGYVVEGRTPADLAAAIGVDGDRFQQTLADYNAAAAEGRDPAFGKGGNTYNRYNGDPARVPNPCLAPIASDRLYAVEVKPAAFASAVGLSTNANGCVLGEEGRPISGLYAVGNDMASIMRGTYPGPGITIGPAMVFAYRAVRHAQG